METAESHNLAVFEAI